jgi:hypothetical protein
MTFADIKDYIEVFGTVVGVAGFVIGLFRHFSDVNDRNIREWQKVVIQKILQQNALQQPLPFTRIQEIYRTEAQAFSRARLSKSDISEDALRRVMVELVSSSIAVQGAGDIYSLKVSLIAPDVAGDTQRKIFMENQALNEASYKYLSVNPYRNTVQEFAAYLCQATAIDAGHVDQYLQVSLLQGGFILDAQGKVALASINFKKG